MEREQALSHFTENYLEPKLLEKIIEIDRFFRENKDKLSEELRDNFRQLCNVICIRQESQNRVPIQSIKLSLLRTSLNEGKALCRWDVYDNTGRWEWKTGVYVYDTSWSMHYLPEIIQELDLIRRKYVLALVPHDLIRIKQTEVRNFYLYVIQLARHAFYDVGNMPEFGKIQRENNFSIDLGEFLEEYSAIYLEADTLSLRRTIKKQLKRKPHYCYQSIKDLILSEEQYIDINLSYCDAQGCDFSASVMKNGMFVGTIMRNCQQGKADFSDSCIYDADFSNSCLEEANFSGVKGRNGLGDKPLDAYKAFALCSEEERKIDKSQIPSFFGVRFCGSNLTKTNFSNADLRGADFQNAILKQTCFENCLLSGAIFLKKDSDNLELSAEQIQKINWV